MRRCFCCSMGFLRSVSLDAAPFHPLPEPRCSLFLRGPEGTRIARPITPARWIEAPKGSRIGRAINSLGSLQTQRVSNSSNPDGLGVVLRTNGARKGRAMIRYLHTIRNLHIALCNPIFNSWEIDPYLLYIEF